MKNMVTEKAMLSLDTDAETENIETTKLNKAISLLEPRAALLLKHHEGHMHIGRVALQRPLFQESLMG